MDAVALRALILAGSAAAALGVVEGVSPIESGQRTTPAPRTETRLSQDSGITPAMVALGDSVFHGRAGGGICFTCHGPDARGIRGLGPDLTDGKWLHGDGSYTFIVGLVEKGVPKPKESAAPMLPKGGGQLNAAQIRAVAAFVYSLQKKASR